MYRSWSISFFGENVWFYFRDFVRLKIQSGSQWSTFTTCFDKFKNQGLCDTHYQISANCVYRLWGRSQFTLGSHVFSINTPNTSILYMYLEESGLRGIHSDISAQKHWLNCLNMVSFIAQSNFCHIRKGHKFSILPLTKPWTIALYYMVLVSWRSVYPMDYWLESLERNWKWMSVNAACKISDRWVWQFQRSAGNHSLSYTVKWLA